MSGTEETLIEIFCRRLDILAGENELTAEERKRIEAVFRKALANTYMDDQQIYRKLTGEEPV